MNNEQRLPPFVPGLKLAAGFFRQAVEPILASHFPDLRYSAALIGTGSEVLGFDTEMSSDHHWGPRVMLFLRPEDFNSKREGIRAALGSELPITYLGYSTNFSAPNPEDKGVQIMRPAGTGPVNHRVETYTLDGFFLNYMNIRIAEKLSAADWLTLPQQKVRSVTAGGVFHDDLGLEEIRERFSWYPRDVWLYILASIWTRIGQEEHLMGRAGYAGDETGSAIIGARLVRDIMRLAFLMERQYPSYAKWFGTAFSQLKSAGDLSPMLTSALKAKFWQEREAGLCDAYEFVARMHNTLGISQFISAEAVPFWGRPFKIIRGERFAKAIIEAIIDPEVVPLTKRRLIGNIDMVSDNTDFLEDTSLRAALKALYIGH